MYRLRRAHSTGAPAGGTRLHTLCELCGRAGAHTMMTDPLFLMEFNILLGLIAFFGGLWVKSLQNSLAALRTDNEKLRDALKDYALREDVRRADEMTMNKLDRIDNKIDTFIDRLNTKADKP
jgi:hypothetical protein